MKPRRPARPQLPVAPRPRGVPWLGLSALFVLGSVAFLLAELYHPTKAQVSEGSASQVEFARRPRADGREESGAQLSTEVLPPWKATPANTPALPPGHIPAYMLDVAPLGAAASTPAQPIAIAPPARSAPDGEP